MEKQLMDDISSGLKAELSSKFGLSEAEINGISATGQNALTSGMKQFVLKNGSAEIEEILLKKKEFEGSGLKSNLIKLLSSDLNSEQSLTNEKANQISEFSTVYLVGRIVEAFQSSTFSKDLNGICGFLGIDKNLLKMVNSPMGKMFGKFF